jgi:hypothetical protein
MSRDRESWSRLERKGSALSNPAIGIDIGGVIIDRDAIDNSDTSLFGPNYLKAKAVEGVFDAVARLNTNLFKDRVFLVSKCGESVEKKTREWLRANGFHNYTGVPEENLHFCRQREEKAPIAMNLKLTHFVDDRAEILHHLHGIVPHRILFRGTLRELERFWGKTMSGVLIAGYWPELVGWIEGRAAVSNEPKEAS